MFSRVAPSIYITDIDRTLGFYRDGLGFSLVHLDEPTRRAVVAQGSAVLFISTFNPPRRGRREST